MIAKAIAETVCDCGVQRAARQQVRLTDRTAAVRRRQTAGALQGVFAQAERHVA